MIRDSEGLSRGFAYVTVSASTAEVERMTKTLNGTLWHGRRLRIAPAKVPHLPPPFNTHSLPFPVPKLFFFGLLLTTASVWQLNGPVRLISFRYK